MAGVTFGATVSDWAAAADRRQVAIFKESTQRMDTLMQARIPVDTGFARASIRASTEAMPPIEATAAKPKAEKDSFQYDPMAISLVIASAKPGQRIFVGWTANYVQFLELGHSKQAPTGFIRVSALEWPRIVATVTQELKARNA